MAKIIELNVGDKTYKLEYNRRVLLEMEQEGLIGDKSSKLREEKPFEFIYKFIGFAFRKNHPDLSKEELDAVIDEIGDLNAFVEALAEIIKSCVEAVENKSGNAHWEKK